MVKVEMIVGTGQPTDFRLRSLEGDEARSWIRAGWNVGDLVPTTLDERNRYEESTEQFLGTNVRIHARRAIVEASGGEALTGVTYLAERIEP